MAGNDDNEVHSVSFPSDGYGPAVTRVMEEDDGSIWIGNDEYWTQVPYCPICGEPAGVAPE